MAPDGKDRSNIPVNFLDEEGEFGSEPNKAGSSNDDQEWNSMAAEDEITDSEDMFELDDDDLDPPLPPAKGSTGDLALNMGGP